MVEQVLSHEEEQALVEDALRFEDPTTQLFDEVEAQMEDYAVAWEAYDVLMKNVRLHDEYETSGTTIPEAVEAVSNESIKLACKTLGIEDFLAVSQERVDFGGIFSLKSEWLKTVAIRVKESYKVLSNAVEQAITNTVYDNKRLSIACDIVKNDIESYNDDDASKSEIKSEARIHAQSSFGTLLAINPGVKTLDELAKYLLSIEKSISMPRNNNSLSEHIQRVMPRANVDEIIITKEMVAKDYKTNMGINTTLNKYFHEHMPSTVRGEVNKDFIGVVDFYGKRCGGFVLAYKRLMYTSGKVMRETHENYFTEPMSKRYMLELLGMAKRFSLHFEGFKNQVDNDIYSGKKVMRSLDNIDRIISKEDKDAKVLNSNLDIVEHYVRVVPHVANANIKNYFIFTKMILWLVRINYTQVESK